MSNATITETPAAVKSIPLPTCDAARTLYGHLYRGWVHARRYGYDELAAKAVAKYQAVIAAQEVKA